MTRKVEISKRGKPKKKKKVSLKANQQFLFILLLLLLSKVFAMNVRLVIIIIASGLEMKEMVFLF